MTRPSKRIVSQILRGIFILSPIVFLVLPANYFDYGDSMCISVVLFDQKCWGCGITRALQHAMHLEFSNAFKFNQLFPFVAVSLVYVWLRELVAFLKIIKE